MNQTLREGFRYTHLGLTMVVITLIGLGAGYYADDFLRTSPWLTVIGLILGFAAGMSFFILEIIKLAQSVDEEEGTDE